MPFEMPSNGCALCTVHIHWDEVTQVCIVQCALQIARCAWCAIYFVHCAIVPLCIALHWIALDCGCAHSQRDGVTPVQGKQPWPARLLNIIFTALQSFSDPQPICLILKSYTILNWLMPWIIRNGQSENKRKLGISQLVHELFLEGLTQVLKGSSTKQISIA